MAFTGSNWGRRVKLTGLAPASALAGYVAVIALANIPVEAIDAGANSALSGGGDLRFSTDDAGANQLPCEVVSFVTSATPGNRQCQVHVRFSSYETGAREVWMFYSKAGETQPVATAAFGRNATWADYAAVLHLNESSGPWLDSTGNGHDATIVTGSISSVATNHPFGDSWLDFTKSQKLKLASSASMLNSSPLTMSFWGDLDQAGTYDGLFGCWDGGHGTHLVHMFAADKMQINDATSYDFVNISNTTGLKHMVGTHDTSGMLLYKNGALIGSDTATPLPAGITNTHDYIVGAYYIAGSAYSTDGRVGEVRARASVLSADHIDAEWDNQNDPSAFWAVGTPEGTGGGITKTITDTAAGNDALFPSAAFSLQDIGSGNEVTGLAALLQLVDIGAGVESLTPGVSLAVVDSGVGNDSQLPTALVPVFETALGIDQVSGVSVTLALSDAGASTDNVSKLADILKAIADVATGSDVVGPISVSLPVADLASGSDITTIAVTLSLQDLAAGTDLFTVITDIIKSVADSGLGSDALANISGLLSVTDVSNSIDQPAINVQLNLSDISVGSDNLTLLQAVLKLIQDSATGSDNLAISVAVPVADAGSGQDVLASINALLALVDAAGGTDAIISFDTQINIAKITFTVKQRSIGFQLRSPSIDFNLKKGGS